MNSSDKESDQEENNSEGFKIPMGPLNVKKGEFESPYRHYQLSTVIGPHSSISDIQK